MINIWKIFYETAKRMTVLIVIYTLCLATLCFSRNWNNRVFETERKNSYDTFYL